MERLQGICDAMIAVNDGWRMLAASSVPNPPPAHLYAADFAWWEEWVPRGVLTDFEGSLWTADDPQWMNVSPADWGISTLETVYHDGLDTRPGIVVAGGNGGYQAAGLAWHLLREHYGLPGRAIYLGLDLSFHEGRTHWFGKHPTTQMERTRQKQLETWIRKFCTMNPTAYGLEIWNCSRRTALHCFPEPELEAVCAHLSSVRATRCAA